MDALNALGMSALGGAIAADVAATFVVEHAAQQRNRRLWVTAAAILLASLALFAWRWSRSPRPSPKRCSSPSAALRWP
jgi:hypothetical protein